MDGIKMPLAELFGLKDRIEPDSNGTPFLWAALIKTKFLLILMGY